MPLIETPPVAAILPFDNNYCYKRLEAALHSEFSDRRVNASNLRKEFFRVTLGEVEEAVGTLAPDASFFRDREAQEWHETLAMRKRVLVGEQAATGEFPESI